ncbi:cytochrome b/b6 domain-containing protein [Roseococcus sp. YIM B11640]|uniref:cytochrome b/b6 domain-containing protein n=1 Tax=Roseococcus sp. YIM B11640 TaxID=3133973 RepID=UPI003C7EA528
MERVKVWDGWVRLCHWGIVACLTVSYFSARNEAWDVHYVSGYTLLGLLGFRILWGFVGSENARFAHFLRSPAAALRHLAHLFRREPDIETGHNPAGGWMALVLLLMLAVQAGSGLFANHDVGFTYSQHGPLAMSVSEASSEWATTLHVTFFDWLLVAVALHVLAVLAYALFKRQDLVRPMVTGSKAMPAGAAVPPRHGHPLLAVALAVAAALGVWAVTRFGGGA